MAICLNNSYLLFGHTTLIVFNLQSQEINEIELKTYIEQETSGNHRNKTASTKIEDKCITSISYNTSASLYLITTDNKEVHTLDNQFKVLRNIFAKRAISKATFDLSKHILVADKTGDVYLYKAEEEAQLLLGHLSMLLDIKISNCGKFIITSDRDEKIRISRYPNAYNIESYCLGHEEFVTNVELWKDVLISASGDGTIRVWSDFPRCKLKLAVNCNEVIDNTSLLDRFKKNMSDDNIEVHYLPIKDMQVFEYDCHNLYIAVSVHLVNKILIYCLSYKDNNDVSLNYVASVDFVSDLVAFDLSVNKLCILTSDSISLYSFINGNFVKDDSSKLSKFVDIYRLTFAKLKAVDVQVLYKKTFDNVQEYMDRKKIRLELKS